MSQPSDMVEEVVLIGEHEISLLRPRDREALLDEQAFEREQFLPYWAELWPSGRLLAKTVADRALRGRSVLELGCGLGVPSICAALAGGSVTASDWSADAIELLSANARANGVAVDALECSWQRPEAITCRAPWDLVLAADVLYERRNVALLLDLLPRLVSDRGTVLIADPGRPPLDELLARAGAADGGWFVRTAARGTAPSATVFELRRRQPSMPDLGCT